jgi:hypothetical protein
LPELASRLIWRRPPGANDEARMTKEIRFINDEGAADATLLHYSDFIIPSSFNASPARTIRHSSF